MKFAPSSLPTCAPSLCKRPRVPPARGTTSEAFAKIVREHDDTLLIVDAITGLGTTHLDVDGWGVDVIIGGSQKALDDSSRTRLLRSERARMEADG